MTQALEINSLPHRRVPRIGWLGRIGVLLFGVRNRRAAIALQYCSRHVLRDIGLVEDATPRRLLRDDDLFRR
jgi:hypothetical protein